MKQIIRKTKILLTIESLQRRGKQRRFIELLSYLEKKNEYEIIIITFNKIIQYPNFFELKIPYYIIERKLTKYDPTIINKFTKICKKFHPDLIHAWGSMPIICSLPYSIRHNIPVINSQISTAPLKLNKLSFNNFINNILFKFSDFITANSLAGLNAFNISSKKSQVIYNGVNLDRFTRLPEIGMIKKKYNIQTKYAVIMIASFSNDKKFDLFINAANQCIKVRKDITFIGVGNINIKDTEYKRIKEDAAKNPKILLPGSIDEVEALINACDIGVLFTFSEGISNAIIEYMALGKPVITNEGGGTKEIVHHDKNGYLITNEKPSEVAEMILDLIDNGEKRISMGLEGKKLITESFSLNQMGRKFEEVYNKFIPKN